jgi:hypothetical protein
LQTKIWAAMANCVADNDNPLELVNQLKSRIPFPDFIKDFGPDVEGQIASVSKGLISVLDRTEITIFTDSGFDYCGVEATFNANIFQEANGEGTTNLSVNVGVSKPLGPEVSF